MLGWPHIRLEWPRRAARAPWERLRPAARLQDGSHKTSRAISFRGRPATAHTTDGGSLMARLAINGGERAAGTFQVPEWPRLTDADRQAVIDVLDGKQWGRLYPNSRAEQFERAFAAYQDAKHGVAVSNGTVAIELALL